MDKTKMENNSAPILQEKKENHGLSLWGGSPSGHACMTSLETQVRQIGPSNRTRHLHVIAPKEKGANENFEPSSHWSSGWTRPQHLRAPSPLVLSELSVPSTAEPFPHLSRGVDTGVCLACVGCVALCCTTAATSCATSGSPPLSSSFCCL
jgi:hypothetical protein